MRFTTAVRQIPHDASAEYYSGSVYECFMDAVAPLCKVALVESMVIPAKESNWIVVVAMGELK